MKRSVFSLAVVTFAMFSTALPLPGQARATAQTAGRPAAAAPPPVDCSLFDKAIEYQVALISDQTVVGIFEPEHRSVAYKQVQLQRVTNAWLAIQTNLTIMAQYRCPLPRIPISHHWYMTAAWACASTVAREARDPVKCNPNTWKRTPAEESGIVAADSATH